MNNLQGKLVAFFLWLMKESLKSQYAQEMTGGHACAGLAEDLMLGGVERFVERITQGSGTEYRLNSAGLKLYIDINKGLNRARVRIGGDQKDYYPNFVAIVAAEIKRRGLDDDHYYANSSGIISWRNIEAVKLTERR